MVQYSLVGLAASGCVGYGIMKDRREFTFFGFALGVGFLLGMYEKEKREAKKDLQTSSGGNTTQLALDCAELNVDEVNIGLKRAKSSFASQQDLVKFMSPQHEDVFRLVLTGGPCAGKSTCIATLGAYLESKGFAVIHITETSTLLKNGGICWSPRFSNDFQYATVAVQIVRENEALKWAHLIAKTSIKKKAVIIFDRGLCDGYAFVDPSVMEEAAIRNKVDTNLFKRYDCVFHLRTAADGAEKFYKLTDYRHETVEQAIAQDRKLEEVWAEHSNHFVFRNEGSFSDKIENVIGKLCDCLGIQQMKRDPRRFLLKSWPNVAEGFPIIRESFIKTYIDVPSNEPGHVCSFVRKSQSLDRKERGATYVLKQVIRKENQLITRKNIITKEKYNFWLKVQDQSRHTVEQERLFFSVAETGMFEIVKYITPREGLVLCNLYENVDSRFDCHNCSLPINLDIIREVTGESEFSAHSISTNDKHASKV